MGFSQGTISGIKGIVRASGSNQSCKNGWSEQHTMLVINFLAVRDSEDSLRLSERAFSGL